MKTNDDIKDSGTPQPLLPDYSKEDLSPMDEAEIYDNGPEASAERRSNEAVKGAAWLFGIVAIFAVAILFAWLVGRHSSPIDIRGADRQLYSQTLAKQEKSGLLTTNPAKKANYHFMAVLVPTNSSASIPVGKSSDETDGNSAQTSTSPASSNTSASTASISSADEDRIEREAREVIHGDFGDNPGRKARLGADYAAVQARVNQILH